MHVRLGAMNEHSWDGTAALSAAPIFDDAVYHSEALGLSVNQTEDDLDAELAMLARESGIQDPYRYLCPPPEHHVTRALSTTTLESDHRSSVSIHSQETQSTGFTSAPSRTSRDHVHASDRSPASRLNPSYARASVAVENPSSRPKAGVTAGPRRSSSTLTVAKSVLSSSSSLQQEPPRKRRGSALFAMFRKDPTSCASRSHHGHRSTKLECGHALSSFDVRVHVQDAMKSGTYAVPNCCGKALPRALLEGVLTKQETDLILSGTNTLPSSDTGSLPDSGYSENGLSSVNLPETSNIATPPSASSDIHNTSVRRTRHQKISVDHALAQDAFTSFKIQQKEQLESVSNFECNQRKALLAHQQQLLRRLAIQHKASREEQEEQHLEDLERLEEKQINIEHDLRTTHDQETKNIATALKFMEGYCLDTNADDPEHARLVTEEDFRKLDRQRLLQHNLPQKHQNAINVLRAKQEREIKRRLENQEQDLKKMDEDYVSRVAAVEEEHKKQREKLEQLVESRRKRLLQRWELKFEIWRKDWEAQHETTFTTTLEHEAWPPRKADHVLTIADSSSLSPYIRAAA